MINWTEEDIKFVCEGIVMPIVNEVLETNDKIDIIHEEAYGKLFDSIIEKLTKTSYNQRRDITFLLDLIAKQEHLDRDGLYNVYNIYCEQYDKLHKEKQDGK
jgi:hypothetical protein